MDTNSTSCPICSQPTEIPITAGRAGEYKFVGCQNCGKYEFSIFVDFEFLASDTRKRAALSHGIREMSEGGVPCLTVELMKSLLERPLPSAVEQCDKLLLWLACSSASPGRKVWITTVSHQAVVGAQSVAGVKLILDYVIQRGWVEPAVPRMGASGKGTGYDIGLTVPGWTYVDDLKRRTPESRIAFMAMKFGDQDLDLLFTNVLKPAVAKTGFDLRRVIDAPRAGLIDDKIRVDIRNARFLIADLTHENAGAYWEAGFAEGLGKPVIYTCEEAKFKRDKTHFDTNHHLTIQWSNASPEKVSEDLKATIRATLPSVAKMTDD